MSRKKEEWGFDFLYSELRFCKYENCYKPDRSHFCRCEIINLDN